MRQACIKTCEREVREARLLAPLYAGRCGILTATLQYVFQTVVLGGSGEGEAARSLERLAADRLYDLEKLGALLKSLGADPLFSACPPYPVSFHTAAYVDYSRSLPQMLAADLRLEREILHALDALGATLEGEAAETARRLHERTRGYIDRLCRLDGRED